MSAVVRALHVGRLRSGPWQNHELAEFYRVIDVLGRAGLAVVPDMGVSDEGDPWFAFCHPETGEIIVHCARIDGVFVATSIALNEVFRGNEIRDVINAIMRSKHFALATAVSDKRLYLHPAAVFAAFIAAALLFSKHVSAHDLSTASSSDTQPEGQHHWGKFLAAVKSALSDASSGSQSGATVDPAFSDTVQPGSPLPLAVLMSAAISLTVPVVGGADDAGGAALGTVPLANPGDLLSPTALSSTSLSGIADSGSTISPWVDFAATMPNAPLVDAAQAGSIPDTENTTSFSGPTGTDGQDGSLPPSFLAGSITSNDSSIHHFAVLPLHTETSAVVADSASVAWVPAVHPYELSEISATALAVFLGTTQPTTLADVSNIVTIPLPPSHDTSSADGTPPASTVVVAPPSDTTGSSTPGSSTTDTQPTGTTSSSSTDPSTAPATDTPPLTTTTTNSSTPTDTPPVDTSVTVVPTPSTDTSPIVVSTSPTDPSPSTVSTPPVDTSVTTPLPTAPSSTGPTTIDMAANPTGALGELLDYALTDHPINATFALTSSLAAMLTSYTAEIGGPAHLVVFDSSNVFLPAFEFSNGVLFVDDHQLGIAESQAPSANLVTVDLASGGVMTLLGVVDTTHLIF